LAVAPRLLAPGESVELLAPGAFVLAVHRAIELELRPERDPIDREARGLPSGRLARTNLRSGCSGDDEHHPGRDPQLVHASPLPHGSERPGTRQSPPPPRTQLQEIRL